MEFRENQVSLVSVVGEKVVFLELVLGEEAVGGVQGLTKFTNFDEVFLDLC